MTTSFSTTDRPPPLRRCAKCRKVFQPLLPQYKVCRACAEAAREPKPWKDRPKASA